MFNTLLHVFVCFMFIAFQKTFPEKTVWCLLQATTDKHEKSTYELYFLRKFAAFRLRYSFKFKFEDC